MEAIKNVLSLVAVAVVTAEVIIVIHLFAGGGN